MSSPFVAEIRIFGCNFAPTGWAQCNGQLLPIAQNTALFSLLGTYYGGDGKSTFALPHLQGSAPVGAGPGGGLLHPFLGQTENGTLKTPSPTEFSGRSRAGTIYQDVTNTNLVNMNLQSLSITGSSLP